MKLGHLFREKQQQHFHHNYHKQYNKTSVVGITTARYYDDRSQPRQQQLLLDMDDTTNISQVVAAASLATDTVEYSLETLTANNRDQNVESELNANLGRQFKLENSAAQDQKLRRQQRRDTSNNEYSNANEEENEEKKNQTVQQQQLANDEEQSTATTKLQQQQKSPQTKEMISETNNSNNVKKINNLQGHPFNQSNKKFVCHGCNKSIRDRYIMKVFSTRECNNTANSSAQVFSRNISADDLNFDNENCLLFHENCLKCSICNCSLEKTCFARNNKLFCPNDYFR